MDNLLDLLYKSEQAPSLIGKKGNFCVEDVVGVSLLFATVYKQKPSNYSIICPNLYTAQKIYNMLSTLIGDENVILFPSDDVVRSEYIASSKELLAQRLNAAGEAINAKNKILISHASSIILPYPTKGEFISNIKTIKVGDKISLDELKESLTLAGYSRVNKIDQSMQFAVRGDIFDIFSVNYDRPIRIEFFDDVIESIKEFDIGTQTSKNKLNKVEIFPANEYLLNQSELENFEEKIKNQLRLSLKGLKEEEQEYLTQKTFEDIDIIKQKLYNTKISKYYQLIKENVSSILDYFKPDVTFIVDKNQFEISINYNIEEGLKFVYESVKNCESITGLNLFLDYKAVLFNQNSVEYSKEFIEDSKDISFDVVPILFSKANYNELADVIRSYFTTHLKVVLAVSNKLQYDSLSTLFNDEHIPFETLGPFELPEGNLGISLFDLEQGFEIKKEKIIFISSNELFGYHNRSSRFINRYKESSIIKNYEDLKPGDYIVHEFYGIGQFVDISTIEVDGIHRDYLNIKYAGTSTIYVPLSQFRLVKKYSGRDEFAPKLSNINSDSWSKTKKRIKERVNELADKLFNLYQERKSVEGFAFQRDDEFQIEFEKEFPYELTNDQAKALSEIKEDMESNHIMDRLVCGDVGFGKTEVAFRAIFKCILSGKQAAILCPTTLLARQHYESALARFAKFDVSIGILSRLVPEQSQKTTIKDFNNEKINILIGTHRILSKEIDYKNLGLLVIDEEQRFGVEQKEKIKELKTSIDVLSLSATPIPRTLQLSLLGVRSISQIETAPNNRMPIQTYVTPYKGGIIKELISRELSRKGQVFYVHNVVDSIYQKAASLQHMLPSAKLGVVHGQMDKEEIEDVMMNFYSGEIDILVATSIIENGIDIPNANLILVENADKFGLSQLYQIKGRVGRGNRVAYAYLFYNEVKVLNKNAQKRLKAIQEFSELGSGYKIAQRDLMIRGAGDILGPEQAGFIDVVGMDLYLKLLSEAIEEKKTGIPTPEPKPLILFNIDAYIPEHYAIKDDKFELYSEIEKAKTSLELNDLTLKIKDIYGRIPPETKLLLDQRRLDIMLSQDSFDKVTEYPGHIILKLSKAFTGISGIGNDLFECLSPYLKKIKISYINRELSIRLEKEGNWMVDLAVISSVINDLYDSKKEN